MNIFLSLLYKYLVLVCILLLVVPSTIFPQDSLNTKNLYSHLSGTEKIDSLNNYTTKLTGANANLKYNLGKEIFSLSEEEDYTIGKISALNNIGMSLIFKNEQDSAIVFFKKALKIANLIDNKMLIFRISRNIANGFIYSGNFDSSLFYDRKAIRNATIIKDSSLLSNAINSIGVTYWKIGRFNASIKLYKTSLRINRKLKDSTNIVKLLNNIGSSYYQLGNKELALDYYIQASDVKRAIDTTISPIVLNNIGLVYLELKDTLLARKYFDQAMAYSIKTENKLGIAYGYFNYGDLKFELKSYADAIDFYQKAIKYYAELKDLNAVAKITNRIGKVYLITNQFKKAENKFITANALSKKYGILLIEIESTINLAKISILRGDYKKAEESLNAVLIMAQNEKLNSLILQIYEQLIEVYTISKEYKNAFEIHLKFDLLSDSLFSEQSARNIADTKEKYEVFQKERENIFLESQNIAQKLRIEKQKNEFLYLLAGIVFSLIVIIYLISLVRNHKQKNTKLSLANEKIELINKQLNNANRLLKKSNSTKDKFFSIIAHDLKNPFNTLLGASQILNLDDGSLSDDEKKELIDVIASDTKKLYELLENLLFWARSQTGKVKVSKTEIELKKTISDILLLYKSGMNKKNITYVLDIPDSYSIYFDEFMFSTIIRNLLSNAIKFSYYNGKITFRAIEKGNKIVFSIEDEGIGISEENLKNLFDEGSNYKAVGTDNEKGTGLGLILCNDFAIENDATISVSSVIDKGTTFELTLQKT